MGSAGILFPCNLGIADVILLLGNCPFLFIKKISMKNSLRELRAKQGWSQADLAEKLGVSRQTINAIETEKYDPSLPLAFKIAEVFNMKIEDIFTPNHRK
jgi:putative transcriptional regulator